MTQPELSNAAGDAVNVVQLRPEYDHAWFAQLFKENAQLISRFLYRRTQHDAVEDLTAETFATAWRKREDIPVGMEVQWLYKTAGFLAANHNRKKSAITVEEFPEIQHDSDPALVVIEDAVLRTAFFRLSEKDRKVLVLAAWEGQSAEQIAKVLDITPNAAAVALSRARARFSKSFEQESGESSSLGTTAN